jgi:hypothetical protein
LKWIKKPGISGIGQIFFVSDVVGSGKTALAHAIARECVYNGFPLSSFFFDRKAGRTNPRDFVSTLARDLGSWSDEVARRITLALRAEPGLAISQSISLVFQKLILDPVAQSHTDGPFVVVIDALDQIDNEELLTILRRRVPNLPGNFRFFLTFRPEGSILRRLVPNNIQPYTLNIHEAENRTDMALYIDHRLADIAEHHGLNDWPNPDLFDKFLEKAEGLFIWVATVCEYLLRQVVYPDKMLEVLLESMGESQLPPDQKMDSLYSTILDKCHWEDTDFVEGYQQVMGAIVAAKLPLTSDALQAIHGPEPRVQAILLRLASLVTGVTQTHTHHPVRILHNSFREFITLRALDLPGRHIRTREHSARLATLCLHILNDIFASEISGTGYLSIDSGKGIPDVEVDHITEEGWYAVRFWHAHIIKVAKPVQNEVVVALRTFLSKHLITWVEVLVSRWPYQSLTSVRRWLKVCVICADISKSKC